MVAPRAYWVQIGFKFGVVQLCSNLLASQLYVPVVVKRFRHHDRANADGIRPVPWLRSIVKQTEFGRERVLMLRDEEIDTAGVVVDTRAVGRIEIRVDTLCRGAHL